MAVKRKRRVHVKLSFPSADKKRNEDDKKNEECKKRIDKKTAHALRQKRYRHNLKKNPIRHHEYKLKEAKRMKEYRMKPKSAEKIEHTKKLAREREKIRRDKLKKLQEESRLKGENTPEKVKPTVTRHQAKARRLYNKLKKEEQRARMSPQQVRREKERNREYYKRKKEKDHQEKQQMIDGGNTDKTNEPKMKTPTKGSVRSAALRASKALPQNKRMFARTLKHIINFASPKKQNEMEKEGFSKERLKKSSKHEKYITSLRTSMKKYMADKSEKWLIIRRKIVQAIRLSKNSKMKTQMSKDFGTSNKFLNRYACNDAQCNRKIRKDKTDAALTHRINDFFQQPTVSDPVSEMKALKKGEKNILNQPLRSLFQLYKEEHSDDKLSFATFAKHRPHNVQTMSHRKHLQCCCEYCENMTILLNTYNKYCVVIGMEEKKVAHIFELVNLTVCSNDDESGCETEKKKSLLSYTCSKRQCNLCGVKKLDSFFQSVINSGKNDILNWSQWKLGKKEYVNKNNETKEITAKVKQAETGNIQVVCSEIKAKCEYLSIHLFLNTMQKKYYQFAKTNPKDSLVTVSDFSENYTTFYSREVSAAHWMRNQITIHPIACFYQWQECDSDTAVQENILCITDDLNHDYHAVNHFQRAAVEHIRQQNVCFDKITGFTDGCGGQYKSRNTFLDVSYSETERNFFASNHGKGPCDSSGGVFKSEIKKAVILGKVNVQTAKDMYEYAAQHLCKPAKIDGRCNHQRRSFIYVDKIDHNRERASSTAVKGIRQFHQVTSQGSGKISIRYVSCCCNNCVHNLEEQCSYKIPPRVEQLMTVKIHPNVKKSMKVNLSGKEKLTKTGTEKEKGKETDISKKKLFSYKIPPSVEKVKIHPNVKKSMKVNLSGKEKLTKTGTEKEKGKGKETDISKKKSLSYKIPPSVEKVKIHPNVKKSMKVNLSGKEKLTKTGTEKEKGKETDISKKKSFIKRGQITKHPNWDAYAEIKKYMQIDTRLDFMNPDGNCYFRAVSKFLHATENFHLTIRKAIVNFIRENISVFSMFIDGNVDAHLSRMSRSKAWGTQCEIYAAAGLLERDIYVLTPCNGQYKWLRFEPVLRYSDNKMLEGCRCFIAMVNTDGSHYDLISQEIGSCNCGRDPPKLEGITDTLYLDVSEVGDVNSVREEEQPVDDQTDVTEVPAGVTETEQTDEVPDDQTDVTEVPAGMTETEQTDEVPDDQTDVTEVPAGVTETEQTDEVPDDQTDVTEVPAGVTETEQTDEVPDDQTDVTEVPAGVTETEQTDEVPDDQTDVTEVPAGVTETEQTDEVPDDQTDVTEVPAGMTETDEVPDDQTDVTEVPAGMTETEQTDEVPDDQTDVTEVPAGVTETEQTDEVPDDQTDVTEVPAGVTETEQTDEVPDDQTDVTEVPAGMTETEQTDEVPDDKSDVPEKNTVTTQSEAANGTGPEGSKVPSMNSPSKEVEISDKFCALLPKAPHTSRPDPLKDRILEVIANLESSEASSSTGSGSSGSFYTARYAAGEYILVSVPRRFKRGPPAKYPAEVIKAESDGYEVSYVKTTHTPGLFKWPDKPDIGWVTTDDIIKKLKPPKTENARMGYITFEEV